MRDDPPLPGRERKKHLRRKPLTLLVGAGLKESPKSSMIPLDPPLQGSRMAFAFWVCVIRDPVRAGLLS